jgi:hypothetical protein
VLRVSFQLSILKILAGQNGGRASVEVVKQRLALYYTSGPERQETFRRGVRQVPDSN